MPKPHAKKPGADHGKCGSGWRKNRGQTTVFDGCARQVIDSTTIFDELRRTQALARKYAGGMYWKKQAPYEYLVKTLPDNRQHRIGVQSLIDKGLLLPQTR